MKTIRIYALPSHQTKERTSGVDFARIIQPMKHLNGWSDEEVEFKVDIYDIHAEKEANWLEIAKNYDVIFFNYLNNPWGYAAMGAMARKHGVKLILDLDDALWNLKEDNPAHAVYNKESQEMRDFTSICNDVDHIVVTNDYLKHVVMNNTNKKAKDITSINNFVDLDLYNHKPVFKDTLAIKLLHFGSSTHYNDLNESEFAKGIDRIMSEYPNVTIKMVGAFIPRFKKRWGQRYEEAFGHVDIYQWISGKYREYMDEADIVLAPLTNDIYNRCKSGIKYLEYSAAGKPGVYADMRQYQDYIDHKENGYLAMNDKGWYLSIKELLDDPEKRKAVGEAAFTRIQEETIQKNVFRYAELFKKLIDTKS